MAHDDDDETDSSCNPCYYPPCYAPCSPFFSPHPSLLPPPPPSHSPHHSLSVLLFIIVSALGLCFLLIVYYAIFSKFCSNRNRSATPQTGIDDTHDGFLDENHPSVVDHPIWYIRTVGFDQSAINSIAVFKYRKEDGLIEGSDCSVCLSEFQDDENLRLLPKCNHAFHLPCIDTWLRSHTNCPLCRAPIFVMANSVAREENSGDLGSGEETQIENLVGDGGVGREQSGEAEEGRELVGGSSGADAAKRCGSMPLIECEMQLFDELSERDGVAEDGMQPVRRSVSLDSSMAATVVCLPGEASLQGQIVSEKNSVLVGSSSTSGGSPQKVLFSVKRSFSSGAKFFSSRSSRSRGSVLPL